MLSNYDAKSIAEVMGLTFVRQPRLDVDPAARKHAGNGQPGHAPPDVVMVDADTIFVVEMTTGLRSASSDPRSPSSRRKPGSTGSRVTSPSPIFIEKAVSGGLPRHALRHVAEALAGNDSARVSAFEWDVVPKTTLERRTGRLSVGESERTERIARLFVHARRALGTDDEARAFMTTPHPEFDGRRPLEVAATDLGTRRAERVLNALEYGLAL